MKKTLSLISILVILSSLLNLFSCSSDTQAINDNKPIETTNDNTPIETTNDNKLIGEWELESQTYSDGRSSSWDLDSIKLYKDGTCSVEGELGTWKIVDDELMVLGSYGGRFWDSDSIVGKYHCDGKTLKFFEAQIDGNNNSVDLVYKKAK